MTASILPLRLRDVGLATAAGDLLSELTLTLEPGPVTVILGPNGAGKSLLLRLCHGLLEPSRGVVHWAGNDLPGASRRQAFVFQRPVLLRRSAAANLDYALAVRGEPRRDRSARVAAALERVGLSALGRRPARALSIGEQQRLALARAWLLDPEVLFLDEPTASLDPAATHEVERLVMDFSRRNVKIVLTTHDLGQARRLAGEVVFLHRGRLVEQTAAEEFFDQPASEEGRAFLAGRLTW